MPQAVCLSPSVPVLYTSRSVIVKPVVSRDLSLNDLMLFKANEWVMASYSAVASGKRCTGLREQAGGQCLVGSLPPPYDGLAPPRLFPSNFPMGPPWADVPLPPPKDTPPSHDPSSLGPPSPCESAPRLRMCLRRLNMAPRHLSHHSLLGSSVVFNPKSQMCNGTSRGCHQ